MRVCRLLYVHACMYNSLHTHFRSKCKQKHCDVDTYVVRINVHIKYIYMYVRRPYPIRYFKQRWWCTSVFSIHYTEGNCSLCLLLLIF